VTGQVQVAGRMLVAAAIAAALSVSGRASSHREAPLISQDPLADNTDVYAFVSPANSSTVTLISNFIPLQLPASGPNFWKFDDNVLYEIMVDNDGDAVEDVTFQFRFRTETRNPNTFLYNTGQITSLDDADWNVRQFYSVNRIDGPRRSGRAQMLGQNLPSPPVNVGFRSIPDYASLASLAVRALPGGVNVFAGQRDEGFYVNLGVFDLLGVPPADNNTPDSTAGLNVHTIAIEVPIDQLTANRTRPGSASDANAIIGVWSTASRPTVTTRTGAEERHSGRHVQVSRLGQPLVNEVVIPRALKDAFNAIPPTEDAAALPFVLDPEVPKLLLALFDVRSPAAPRDDLVTIFLRGIPGLNQPAGVMPAEMLRLNVAIAPAGSPNPLGVLGGDLAGFPNGRRVGDDVTDIALRAMAGATPLTPAFNTGINAQLGDGVPGNDVPYLPIFPYLGLPHPGNR
jgi:Domain of unknown function (DUF4331)